MAVLLAPVPRTHIASALEVAEANDGRVAFGSGTPDNQSAGEMWMFFSQMVRPGTETFVYVSATGEGRHYGPFFTLAGVYEGWSSDEREVLHIRPTSTLQNDSKFAVYWILKNFRQLDRSDWLGFDFFSLKESPLRPILK